MLEGEKKDILHKFSTDLYCDLSLDEVRERGESLAQTLEKIRMAKEELANETKDRKQGIKLLEERTKILGDATRFRRERRMVECEVVAIGNGMVNEIRMDTGEVIRNRKMSDAEAQMTMPRIGKVEESKAAAQ